MAEPTTPTDEEIAAQWENSLAEQKKPSEKNAVAGKMGADKLYDKTDRQPPLAQFDNLESESNTFENPEANLDVILDIPVTISMEIGRTHIAIRNLLQLNQGSVVELDRLAGEPMDVLVNGTLIAHGEVVVVNEKFGIRLTDVISAAERVKKLK